MYLCTDLITIFNSRTIKTVESYRGCCQISLRTLDFILASSELRVRRQQRAELYSTKLLMSRSLILWSPPTAFTTIQSNTWKPHSQQKSGNKWEDSSVKDYICSNWTKGIVRRYFPSKKPRKRISKMMYLKTKCRMIKFLKERATLNLRNKISHKSNSNSLKVKFKAKLNNFLKIIHPRLRILIKNTVRIMLRSPTRSKKLKDRMCSFRQSIV
jgi:hypothetical protein